MLWWLPTLALAAVPDKVVADRLGAGAVDRLAIDDAGEVVAGVQAGGVFLLDVDTRTTATAAPCAVKGVAVGGTSDDGTEIFAACEDGTVHLLRWDGSGVEDLETYEVTNELFGVWTYDGAAETDPVYAVGRQEGAAVDTLFTLAPDGTATVRANLVATTGTGGASGAFVDGAVVDTTGTLYLAYDNLLFPADLDVITDVLPFPRSFADVAAGAATLFAVDANDDTVTELSSEGLFETFDVSGVGDPAVVAADPSAQGGWVLVIGTTGARVYIGGEPSSQILGSTVPVTDAVVGPDGSVYAASDDGILVFTAVPWVSDVAISPAVTGDGGEVTVTFTVDEDVDVTLSRDGSTLWEGEAAAGAVEATFEAGDDWADGAHDIEISVVDADGNAATAAAVLTVDNPPEGVTLADGALGFTDGALVLEFTGIPDVDLAGYEVYVTVTPFDPDDYETGGPAFDGDDVIVAPFTWSAAGGNEVHIPIAPLTNGVTYYVAVRAVDAGGLEGPMSNVVSNHPRETFMASDLAGEGGGASCSFAPGLASWAWILVIAGLVAARPARAQDADDEEDGPKRDLTEQRANFEIRYGGRQLDNGTYGNYGKGQVLQLEVGPQLWRFAELDANIGFYQELDHAVDEDGEESSDTTMLTFLQLGVAANLRLHVLDEQFLVPYGRFGFDNTGWREDHWNHATETYNDPNKGRVWGFHYGFGGQLLLDTFDSPRASLLEARTGINDTYLVVEWRQSEVLDGAGGAGDVSGRSITVGLKLDY